MIRVAFILGLLASSVAAESVVATRTIRPQEVIGPLDIRLDNTAQPGGFDKIEEVIGQEALVAIYPGRVVLRGQVGAPAVVSRNQMVELIFSQGGLRIVAEGRALGRGGVGDRIRVMNVASRNVLFGTVLENGTIEVTK